MTFLVGLVVLALVAEIIVHWIAAYGPAESIDQERGMARKKSREGIDRKYAELLSSAGWVDKSKGVVHVPIDLAMYLTVLHFQRVQEDAREAKAPFFHPSSVKVEAPLPVAPPPACRFHRAGASGPAFRPTGRRYDPFWRAGHDPGPVAPAHPPRQLPPATRQAPAPRLPHPTPPAPAPVPRLRLRLLRLPLLPPPLRPLFRRSGPRASSAASRFRPRR